MQSTYFSTPYRKRMWSRMQGDIERRRGEESASAVINGGSHARCRNSVASVMLHSYGRMKIDLLFSRTSGSGRLS